MMYDQSFLDRRQMLAGLAALLGAATLPEQAIAAAAKSKRFLPRAGFKLLSSVCDTILPATDTPGALAAKVPERLDGMLANWASSATREDIIGALNRIDLAARAAHSRGFASLAANEREALLRTHDAAALKADPAAKASRKPSLADLGPIPADPGYKRLKTLTISLYYYSQTGSENELLYEHVPGRYEPSLKIDAKSRPFLGLSLI